MAIYKNTPPVVTSNLVLYLDAGSRISYVSGSTTWTDLSGNGYSGSLTSGSALAKFPTFDSSNQGVLTFDGTGSYIVNTKYSASTTLQNTTIETIFMTTGISPYTSSALMGIFGTMGAPNRANNSQLAIYVNSSGSILNGDFAGNTDYIGVTQSVSLNNWYHVVLTQNTNPKEISLYVNSKLARTTPYTSSAYQFGSDGINIGVQKVSFNTRYFNGKIALCRIYSKTLSAQEVAQNYNALKSRFGLT